MLAKARHPPTPHKKRWGAEEKIQPRFCSLRKKYALLLMRLKPPLFPALFRCFLGGKESRHKQFPLFSDAKIFHSGPSERELWNASTVSPGKHRISKGETLSQNFTSLWNGAVGRQEQKQSRGSPKTATWWELFLPVPKRLARLDLNKNPYLRSS